MVKRRFNLILFITIMLLTGCSGQQITKAEGSSNTWESTINYELGEHEKIGNGTLEYLGSDQLRNFSYEINYPKSFRIGASGEHRDLDESFTSFPLIIDLPDFDVDKLRDEISNITITVAWETVTGELFEEEIEYTVESK